MAAIHSDVCVHSNVCLHSNVCDTPRFLQFRILKVTQTREHWTSLLYRHCVHKAPYLTGPLPITHVAHIAYVDIKI